MNIDIVHDTVCPWCRIGKHNLEAALADWTGEPVNIRYLPYFLNPDLPAEGADFREMMSSKFGSSDLQPMFERVTQAGAAVGLTFNFDKITRMSNTLLSHRLIALAPDDKREALVNALHVAHFENGGDMGALDVLLDTAESVGLDRAEYEALLKSDAAEAEVTEQVAQIQQARIGGVPFFIFEGKWGVSGAQPPHVFKQVLEKVAKETAS